MTGESASTYQDHVTLPWDLNVGMAVQLGPRPLNPCGGTRRSNRALQRSCAGASWSARAVVASNCARRCLVMVMSSPRATQVDSEFATKPRLDDATLSHAEQDVDVELRRRQLALQRFHVLLLLRSW